jgi:aminocarboxymuconate-semialdehyde decarboxylase
MGWTQPHHLKRPLMRARFDHPKQRQQGGSTGGGYNNRNRCGKKRLRGVRRRRQRSGHGADAAGALRMVVCIHPFEAAPTGAYSRYFLGNLVGNLYDTGLAAALMIYGGVLERHPDLRVVLYHAGGALPALVGRLDMGYRLVPECRNAIPRPPSTYVTQFHFDIVGHNRELLGHLVKTYGAHRFVVGSDYPLPAGLTHPVEEVRSLGLGASDQEKILALNAKELLRL